MACIQPPTNIGPGIERPGRIGASGSSDVAFQCVHGGARQACDLASVHDTLDVVNAVGAPLSHSRGQIIANGPVHPAEEGAVGRPRPSAARPQHREQTEGELEQNPPRPARAQAERPLTRRAAEWLEQPGDGSWAEAPLVAAHCGGHDEGVGGLITVEVLRPHVVQKLQPCRPMSALLAGTDGLCEGVRRRQAALHRHDVQQNDGSLPLSGLLASMQDLGITGRAGVQAAVHEVLEHGASLLPHLGVAARADDHAEGHRVQMQPTLHHFLEQLQGILPSLRLRARIDQGVVRHGIGLQGLMPHLIKQND
mmetsp:Transcript_61158/g.158174  ORF Transcript_61158/g.158174 Transcript_61158/m.158174 type:complete len:309 (-) Transcript_61158:1030-1956(-)